MTEKSQNDDLLYGLVSSSTEKMTNYCLGLYEESKQAIYKTDTTGFGRFHYSYCCYGENSPKENGSNEIFFSDTDINNQGNNENMKIEDSQEDKGDKDTINFEDSNNIKRNQKLKGINSEINIIFPELKEPENTKKNFYNNIEIKKNESFSKGQIIITSNLLNENINRENSLLQKNTKKSILEEQSNINLEGTSFNSEENSSNNKNISDSKKVISMMKPEKIFSIKKIKKKIRMKEINDKNRVQKSHGRKFKNSKATRIHNKNSQDNIIRKFKRNLIDNFLKFVNKKFIDKTKEIKKIISSQSKNNNIDFNLNWLNKKLKEVYSENVSYIADKKKKCNNKEMIELIYKEQSETEVIQILNKTVREAMNDYIGIPERVIGLTDLEEDKNQMKNNNENDENYIKKYEYVSINFEAIYKKKTPKIKQFEDRP